MSTLDINHIGDSSPMSALRLLIGVSLATVVTLALMWMMQALVASGDQKLAEERERLALDFVRVERSEVVQRKQSKPDRPPPPQQPPPQPPQPKLDDVKPSVDKIAVSAAPVETEVKLTSGGFSLGVGEGDYLPLAKVAPIYPQRALRRGLEGFCTVQYTVTPTGTTKDIVVLEDQCSNAVFHAPSIEAAKKFKYKPRVRDGKAIEVPGIRNKFTYKLEK